MDPKVSVKVSKECSTIFSSVNTSQVGRGMSRERNERPVESEMEGIWKSSIYRHCCSTFNKKRKKKKKRDNGIGTTLTGIGTTHAKRGSSLLVPVPHLLVPVLPAVNGLN